MLKTKFFILAASSIFLHGCVTTSNTASTGSEPPVRTAFDRAIGKCAAAFLIGSLGGAALGGLFGGRKAIATGAIAGTALAAGQCAILVNLAAKEDKKKIRDAELAALQANSNNSRKFTTKSGKTATVNTTVSAAPLPATKTQPKKQEIAKQVPASTPPSNTADNQSGAGEAKKTQNVQDISQLAFAEAQNSYTECKFTELLIDVDGSKTNTEKQKWCKIQDGTWQPIVT